MDGWFGEGGPVVLSGRIESQGLERRGLDSCL